MIGKFFKLIWDIFASFWRIFDFITNGRFWVTIIIGAWIGAGIHAGFGIDRHPALKAADVITANSWVFGYSDMRVNLIQDQKAKCALLTEENYKDYSVRGTFEQVKSKCHVRLEEIIADGARHELEHFYKIDMTLGTKGSGTSMTCQLKPPLGGMNTLTEDEYATWTGNIRSLVAAIPGPIPPMETLKQFRIGSVRYFDDYAKIDYEKDKRISNMDRKDQIYRGQF